jgi:hypothetical protein
LAKTLRYVRKKNKFYNIDQSIVVGLIPDGTTIGDGPTDDHIGVYIDGELKKTIGFNPEKVVLTAGDGLRAGSLHSLRFAIMTGSDSGGRTRVTNKAATTERMFVKINSIRVDPAGNGQATSISGAIDFVKTLANPSAGHTVSVMDGTYPVYQPIDLRGCDNIKIFGRSRKAANVKISGSMPKPTYLIKSSHSASLAFMTLENSSLSAVDCYSGSVEHTIFAEGLIIQDCFDPFQRIAQNSELRRLIIRRCDYGLRSYDAAQCTHMLIHDINSRNAPSAGGASYSYGIRALTGSTIQNITIYNVTGSYAIDAPGGTVRNCIVNKCKLTDYGIKAGRYKRNLVHDLT